MKKNLIVFGTRPEAIKMAPIILKFRESKNLDVKVCVTAQHREMLDQVLSFFNIVPDYDLNLMTPNQSLYSLTSSIIIELKNILEDYKPDYVYVHGDTTTSMAASIAAFYFGAKICHVEAGLRTNNKNSPFPEEINRQIVGRLADYHFTPTINSKLNLLKENIEDSSIIVTGNTVIDALFYSVDKVKNMDLNEILHLKGLINEKKIILITGHRRENHGKGFTDICLAIKKLVENNGDIQIIYPVHLNPNVKETVFRLLSNLPNIFLINPLSYPAFVWLMDKAHIILTDSGGVQEEAPSLGKPVLVMRNNTERPEAVDAGTVKLVGTSQEIIVDEINKLLNNEELYKSMSEKINPYGDGNASDRIISFIEKI